MHCRQEWKQMNHFRNSFSNTYYIYKYTYPMAQWFYTSVLKRKVYSINQNSYICILITQTGKMCVIRKWVHRLWYIYAVDTNIEMKLNKLKLFKDLLTLPNIRLKKPYIKEYILYDFICVSPVTSKIALMLRVTTQIILEKDAEEDVVIGRK